LQWLGDWSRSEQRRSIVFGAGFALVLLLALMGSGRLRGFLDEGASSAGLAVVGSSERSLTSKNPMKVSGAFASRIFPSDRLHEHCLCDHPPRWGVTPAFGSGTGELTKGYRGWPGKVGREAQVKRP
jgi:hypothetical protein